MNNGYARIPAWLSSLMRKPAQKEPAQRRRHAGNAGEVKQMPAWMNAMQGAVGMNKPMMQNTPRSNPVQGMVDWMNKVMPIEPKGSPGGRRARPKEGQVRAQGGARRT